MIVQLTRQRSINFFSAIEISDTGVIIRRKGPLAVQLPEAVLGAAQSGSVWRVEGTSENHTFQQNGFLISEERLYAASAQFLKPSGDLLARWIAENIEGIGDVKAKRLARAPFDLDEAVRTRDIEKLVNVQGVTAALAQKLIDKWLPSGYYRALKWLQTSGLPLNLAGILARAYQHEAVERLREDPYILASFGISFNKIIDVIGKLKLKVPIDHTLAAIAEHVAIRLCSRTGSTVISRELLHKHGQDICKKHGLSADNLIPAALNKGTLLQCDSGLQTLGSAIQEATVAKFFLQCACREAGFGSALAKWEKSITDKRINEALLEFEDTLPFSMTLEQKNVVTSVMKANFSVISGGAGTGKTTILRAVLRLYQTLSSGLSIYLVALSGRAAQRMTEATGMEAMTIARLVANHSGDKMPNLPEHCLLVVDEASMVDLLSMYKLVGLLPRATRLLLVGDVAQLPPVGAGLVFHAVMKSTVPIFELTEVKRQSANSAIHKLATAVRKNQFTDLALKDEFGTVRHQSNIDIDVIIEQFSQSDRPEENIILTPTRKGNFGTESLNRIIQSCYDWKLPDVLHYQDDLHGWIRWITQSKSELRLGDRIMVTTNDYENDIRNGDLGTLIEVFNEPINGAYGTVSINGISIPISRTVIEKLDLGYAITIHKSQGSQWQTCTLLLPSYAHSMLDQSLLYTAITRATNNLLIFGETELVKKALRRGSSISERKTNLLGRMKTNCM